VAWLLGLALMACARLGGAQPLPEAPEPCCEECVEAPEGEGSPDRCPLEPVPLDLRVDLEDVPVPAPASGASSAGRGRLTTVTFEAPHGGARMTLAIAGDVLLHGRLQRQAYSAPEEVGFRSLWTAIEPALRAADLAVANLEGPAAAGIRADGLEVDEPGRVLDGTVYSSLPPLNYHPTLVRDLAVSGVDLLWTANNHALDRGAPGVVRTLEAVEAAGLRAVGTRRVASESSVAVTTAASVTIAWVAYTDHTNGIPDREHQVEFTRRNQPALLSTVTRLSTAPGVDAVLVGVHWGKEGQHQPTSAQKALAHALVEAGALAVIGTHPHVLGPWEKVVTRDGREALVVYSLGNFVSGQSGLPRRTTILLELELARTAGSPARLAAAWYRPLWMGLANRPYGLEPLGPQSGGVEREALELVWRVLPAGNCRVTPAPQEITFQWK
jgi:poly-gamma-glutamate synthesis protein (capsule biosynthesis protein)